MTNNPIKVHIDLFQPNECDQALLKQMRANFMLDQIFAGSESKFDWKTENEKIVFFSNATFDQIKLKNNSNVQMQFKTSFLKNLILQNFDGKF